ncbi:MAG: hypothetical protein GXY83_16015 [Rhodopirellula sp.]|nr:hypothetical protein [Rhodopirellula sp.]
MNNTMILVTKSGLGTVSPDDTAFGVDMLDKFFHTLERLPEKPAVICFYTEGVKCVAEGSPFVLGLKLLESLGSQVVSCLTCLNYYGIEDQLAVGQARGMPDILRLMTEANKVITI